MSNIIKGGDLMLFIGGKSIGYATNHTLSINVDTKETSTKDNGGKWQTSEVGIISWTASTENLVAHTVEGKGLNDLIDAMIARTELTAVFSVEGSSTDLEEHKLDNVPTGGWTSKNVLNSFNGYTGSVIITSVEVNAPNGDNATYTVQFTGTGALTKLTAA